MTTISTEEIKSETCSKKTFLLGILFALSSFSSFVVDISLYTVLNLSLLSTCLAAGVRLLIATVLARVVSSVYNFFINHRLVFRSKEKTGNSAVKYFALAVCQCLSSYGLVYLFSGIVFRLEGGILETAVKIVVDTVLFVLSFFIQKKLIFKA